MSSNRDIVSKTRSLLRLTSSDQMVSDRMILSYLMDTNIKLVTQQLNKRQSLNSPNLFSNIDCLEMEIVPLWSCCDSESNCEIAKSKKQIPTIVETYYDLAISGVYSIDRKVKFNQLDSPQRLSNLLKIYPNKKLSPYFFIKDNYLYITNPNIEKVSISAFFKDIIDKSEYSCDAVDCFSPMDETFYTIPKLEDDITRITAELIMNTFKRIPEERTSDDIEGN